MNSLDNIVSNNDLKDLASNVLILHSFEYPTLDDAKKYVEIGNYYYCFDALSLCYYDHNLNNSEYYDLGLFLSELYDYDNEHEKERAERVSLFCYMRDEHHPYHNYVIEKKTRPDFWLVGDEHIGVEVVRLSEHEHFLMNRIANELTESNMNIEEAKANIINRHGHKAESLSYFSFQGTNAIGANPFSLSYRKMHFAEQIKKKFDKYVSMINDFDKFIILGDAQSSCIEISSETDADDVYHYLQIIEPNIRSVRVAILWTDESGIRSKEYA